eukprot:CAMPEP_0183339040 /NCGR_PEP_ID=MMETSP0164_2-20130417/6115_1 /TAXON_ID=221442 /ORGANISM="Coccolithus pelagicus ssp braarudi, Strain PLY182g" /LENGTH=45 /DNA_ID= /DNA_START= /DNA_END= /DNA_ORIENTATION=
MAGAHDWARRGYPHPEALLPALAPATSFSSPTKSSPPAVALASKA